MRAGAAEGNCGDGKAKAKVRHDGRQRIKEDGLMCIYVLHLLARFFLEVAFLYGQYTLYGFAVPATYMCSALPCPNKVDCFVSRPTEKTIFLLIMYAVSLLCLALNIWEMLHLFISTICDIIHSRQVQFNDVKPPLAPAGHHNQPLPITGNAKMTCQQNHVSIAIEELQQHCLKPHHKCKHRQASKHPVSKADTVRGRSTTSSSKDGVIKDSQWI
ncbi:hypothetical protein L3Q82_005587 [Scortum barcoo]|uniref:Uncharacterized protein n=1 Tax=Scortum barcoo TaxID=214431 RepID=A0ACB8V9U5_9TELE|nr:hypothetical protein L3Q82_005587 [Scortum barcoo]